MLFLLIVVEQLDLLLLLVLQVHSLDYHVVPVQFFVLVLSIRDFLLFLQNERSFPQVLHQLPPFVVVEKESHPRIVQLQGAFHQRTPFVGAQKAFSSFSERSEPIAGIALPLSGGYFAEANAFDVNGNVAKLTKY